jgi:hypothetical protein
MIGPPSLDTFPWAPALMGSRSTFTPYPCRDWPRDTLMWLALSSGLRRPRSGRALRLGFSLPAIGV